MMRRCYNKNTKYYKDYGGRGIIVCDEWSSTTNKYGVLNFIKWAESNGYRAGLTIDRKDNNGNYEPSNCRWTTMLEQARNKRNNHLVTIDGETKCLMEWSEDPLCTVGHATIRNRLKKGWLPKDAVFKPKFY